jgi:hypothetical protein
MHRIGTLIGLLALASCSVGPPAPTCRGPDDAASAPEPPSAQGLPHPASRRLRRRNLRSRRAASKSARRVHRSPKG